MVESKLVHISTAEDCEQQRHGGIRRSNQLRRDLSADLLFSLPPLSGVSILSRIRYLRGWRYVPGGLTLRGRIKALISVGLLIDFLKSTGCKWKEYDFAVEVGRGPILYLGFAMSRLGLKYSAFPHNIEFMVPGQTNQEAPNGTSFYIETEIYKRAETIYTISTLDAFIIKTIVPEGAVHHYPYQPSQKEAERFRRILQARARTKSHKNSLLFVGTANNPPTRTGVNLLIQEFSTLKECGFELNIAGFGTEALATPAGSNIKIHGSVSDDALDQLLINAAAAIIIQPPTTGFLTRIVELNLSGVPIFISSDYLPAGELEHFGVFQFCSVDEVIKKVLHMAIGSEFEKFATAPINFRKPPQNT